MGHAWLPAAVLAQPMDAAPPNEDENENENRDEDVNDNEDADESDNHSEPGPDAGARKDQAPTPEQRLEALERAHERLASENKALRAKNQELGQALELMSEDMSWLEERVRELMPVKSRLSGYLDVGFFHAGGTGAGYRADIGNMVFPELADVSDSWVFMGDPLSTAVNSRGEPANVGDSRAVAFNSIGARSSFLVNALAVRLFTGIGAHLTLTAAFDLVPRGRDIADPHGLFLGDFLDVGLAYAEYRPALERVELSLAAGKFDSVLGYEYRVQEAPERTSVTPSLICRYLCGHPVGIKARARFASGLFTVNLALTNGSHFKESFAFADEIDANRQKTVAGRVSFAPRLADALELGLSGAMGAQDGQDSDRMMQYHLGADLRVLVSDVEVVAEYVRGNAEGATDATEPMPVPCDVAPCLDYQGAYGLVGYRATNHYIPFVRVDWRDAMHRHGHRFAYVSELVRVTAGARVEIGTHVIVKAEYTLNRELGRIPSIPNDVFTSSLIVTY